MLKLEHLHTLPANFGEYVEDVARVLGGLYGPAAAVEYRRNARKQFIIGLNHPTVDTLAMVESGNAAGLVVSVLQEEVGRIAFIHVLERYAGQGIESRLICEAVRTFQAGGVEGIVSECLTCCDMELANLFASLGFEQIDRGIMMAPLDSPGLAPPRIREGRPAEPHDWPAMAEAIADAYAYVDHPARRLHVEVRDAAHALAYIRKAAEGQYGMVQHGFFRIIHSRDLCVGTILGCRVAPDVGFVLQLAVRRAAQNREVGTRLLQELAARFREAGFRQVVLGVTLDNPAKRLYERLGFRLVRNVAAYVWRRPGDS